MQAEKESLQVAVDGKTAAEKILSELQVAHCEELRKLHAAHTILKLQAEKESLQVAADSKTAAERALSEFQVAHSQELGKLHDGLSQLRSELETSRAAEKTSADELTKLRAEQAEERQRNGPSRKGQGKGPPPPEAPTDGAAPSQKGQGKVPPFPKVKAPESVAPSHKGQGKGVPPGPPLPKGKGKGAPPKGPPPNGKALADGAAAPPQKGQGKGPQFPKAKAPESSAPSHKGQGKGQGKGVPPELPLPKGGAPEPPAKAAAPTNAPKASLANLHRELLDRFNQGASKSS